MNFTLEGLMQAVGCAKWPERWQEIFATATKTYEQEGCRLANPQFYADLQAKYNCFPDHLEHYMQAARQVAADEPLARFLTLLDIAVQDRRNIREDIKNFTRPVTPEGKAPLGYDMICGLALCGSIDYAARRLQGKGVPQEHIDYSLQSITKPVAGFMKRYGGRPGYDLFSWSQRYIDGDLFYFNGLGMELNCGRGGLGCVYQNQSGEQIVLADDVTLHRSGYALGSAGCTDEAGAFTAKITETEAEYIGHPVLADGRTDRETIALPKKEWTLLLGPDTPTIGLHINAKADLSPRAVEHCLETMCSFLDRYFPEVQTRIFTCISWMMDPQMQSFLSENSNIVQFQKRFRYLPRVCAGKAVFFFIYNIPNDVEPNLDTLATDSSLQRGIVAHYKSGKYIYELPGYFLCAPANLEE